MWQADDLVHLQNCKVPELKCCAGDAIVEGQWVTTALMLLFTQPTIAAAAATKFGPFCMCKCPSLDHVAIFAGLMILLLPLELMYEISYWLKLVGEQALRERLLQSDVVLRLTSSIQEHAFLGVICGSFAYSAYNVAFYAALWEMGQYAKCGGMQWLGNLTIYRRVVRHAISKIDDCLKSTGLDTQTFRRPKCSCYSAEAGIVKRASAITAWVASAAGASLGWSWVNWAVPIGQLWLVRGCFAMMVGASLQYWSVWALDHVICQVQSGRPVLWYRTSYH